MQVETKQRFWEKVEKTDSCWNWLGGKTAGYGRIKIKNKCVYAHRFSYSLLKGKLDPNLTIDHLCRNRACVNPDHLEQVTMKINVLRGIGASAINAKKTHCKKGHEYTKENTYVYENNWRMCKTCTKLYYKENRNKILSYKKQRYNQN